MSGPKKNKIKIEPFRHPVAMDPHYAEKTWQVLREAIHEIHHQNASGLSFEELYRNAYNMVLQKHGDKLYKGLIDTLQAHLKTVAAEVSRVQGLAFLRELERRWKDHHKSSQMIRDILMYMDRTYVKQQDRTPVFSLGMNLWRDFVVKARGISDRLLSLVLDLITRERRGELIDCALLRSLTDMHLALGPGVYIAELERPFLQASQAFYAAEAADYLRACDCTDHLRRAEARLAEESARVGHYLAASTEEKVIKVLETELIERHMSTLVAMPNSGVVALMRDDKYEDLGRMYKLFRRVDAGHALMREVMGEHLKADGRAIMEDPERLKSPVTFVHTLLDMKDKVDRIVKRAFAGDRSFDHVVTKSFEHFLNLAPRSPEYISLFIDELLRKGLKGRSEDDTEATLDRVMMLFRFLQEKDVFEKYYKQHLAKRLLSGRVVSDDAERSLLLKLKSECGYQFTSKLESMFTDMKTSRDMMQSFQQHLEVESIKLDIDMTVQVLTTGSWPTQEASQCLLPKELHAACESFQGFYDSTHNGRRLTWQTSMGTADIKATFGNGKRHELSVSTHQMCILLLFNDADSLTYHAIADATGIAPAELKRSLQSLACVKGKNVLKKEPMSKEVGDDDLFTVNDNFSSKYIKIKIGTVSAGRESEPEKEQTRERVEEDRKPQIEAAIVRIMKTRKVLNHNSIISEVTRQLSKRFVPNPMIIKKRIESLIEREFLERDSTDRKLYRYLA